MKKTNNSKKWIGGLLAAMIVLIAIFVIANIIESSDFQFGSGNNERTELFYIGNSDMYEILNDRSGEGFFVYIGRPTCPACREFEPTLRETLRYLDQELRYFEIDIARETDAESEMTVSEILDTMGVGGVPSTVYIVNGEVVDILSGRSQEDIISFFEANGGLN